MAENKDLYEILGVDRSASIDDIKKAAKKLLLKYHPDAQPKNASEEEKKKAEEKFKNINEAKEILTDPEKKKMYDLYGSTSPNQRAGYDPFAGFAQQRRESVRLRPGRDIRMKVPLTIEEIVNGCTKKLKYKRKVRCNHCNGAGGTGEELCSLCGGTGIHVERKQFGNSYYESQSTCPNCHGTGFSVKYECSHCHGEGLVDEEKITEVDIIAGIQEGEVLGVPHEGCQAKNPEAPNGDFLIYPEYNFDKNIYQIDQLDIYQKVKVPFYDALLGSKITVQHPNGRKYKIKVPECCEPNYAITNNSLGLSRETYTDGYITGKYTIVVTYDIPSKLSEEQKKALEEVKKVSEKEE